MGLISQVNVRDVVLILFRLLLFGEKKIIRKKEKIILSARTTKSRPFLLRKPNSWILFDMFDLFKILI
jgi:hypothetical protein